MAEIALKSGMISNKARSRTKEKKERLIIDLNSSAMELIDQLVVRTGASSRAEFVRNLLRLAEVTVKKIEEGNELLLKNSKGEVSQSNFEYILMRK